jgi:serine/threonine protein kinase
MTPSTSAISPWPSSRRPSTTRRASLPRDDDERLLWHSSHSTSSNILPPVEIPDNISPDQLFSLFIALAADVHTSVTHRSETILEHILNKDIGFINVLTSYVGEGRSFTVRLLRCDPPERSLVFKSVLPYSNFTRRDEKDRLGDIILELRALSHQPLRSHRNIVDLLGLGWEADSLEETRKWPVLILEHADGGTLHNFLQNHPDLTFHQRLTICFDVAEGLEALHQCEIVHGDLKPNNVLIFKPKDAKNDQLAWVAKLADFGGSVLDVDKDSFGLLSTGTYPWNAPEWKARLSRDDLLRTDIYSLGLLIWSVMASGVEPILHDLDLFGASLTDKDSEQLKVPIQELKIRDDETILNGLAMAGRRRFAAGVDHKLIKDALSITVRIKSSLRDLGVLRLLLHHSTEQNPTANAKELIVPPIDFFGPRYQPITTTHHIENILVSYSIHPYKVFIER